jgi:hypothetical protein
MDSACNFIACHLTQVTRAQYAFDDVASTIHQSLERGDDLQEPHDMLVERGEHPGELSGRHVAGGILVTQALERH